ncbi:zinc finger SWIM domain-containing protein 3-like, partial [Sceloporus undulatus]|uniref:zinc finger SWIM domain-containing protein 3-like n=1 Tax=Sceloporus undulatus TaxID=8520 RepID=UPI001C4D6D66
MQVKFGCVRLREPNNDKKQHPEPRLCPAYLVLQYSEELDQLVITELNCNHIHLEAKALSDSKPSPLARLAARMAAFKACGSPPPKLRREEPAGVEACNMEADLGMKVKVESDESMTLEVDSEELLPASPLKQLEVPQTEKNGSSNSTLTRVAEVMKNFLRVDAGSLASITMSNDQDLKLLNFQTSKMKSLFVKFPESLLLHQVLSERGHILYAFLVESKDRVGKLVHFAILKEDTEEHVHKMLSSFREFNPEAQKIKVVFVDMSFLHHGVLQELFPSAQVLLSVYHTVRLLEKKLKESRTSFSFRNNLKVALREAVFSTSNTNLDTLSRLVKRLVDPELYEYLHTHWFSCEMLWYMHAKKGLHSCSTYIDSLDLITQKLSNLFTTQLSLETSILRFMEYADCFNTKGLENLNQGFSNLEEDSPSSLIEELKIQTRASVKHSSSTASQHLPVKVATEIPKQSTRHSPAKPVATMLAAVQETCTDLAYQLCLNEWDVVQKSTQLMHSTRHKTAVQLLEDTHQVSKGGRSCSCYFYCRYQLPCRHILSVLLAKRQVVEEAMVAKRWQKKYQHLSILGENLLEYPGHPKGTPEPQATAESEERQDKIQSISKELGNLLLQSDGEELEERSATLKMIVSIWTKCSELQEEEEVVAAAGKSLNIRNVGDLPFLWVKKEEMEEIE